MTDPVTCQASPRPSGNVDLVRYRDIRRATEILIAPLSAEDCQIQSMPDASPAKWHLAHTTWFFETFLLSPFMPGYEPFDPAFGFLFNSYYVTVGEPFSRPRRGLLTRPSLATVMAYREAVDAAMADFLALPATADTAPLLELGLQHEQQHQELILMDIQHAFSVNPLEPAYDDRQGRPRLPSPPPPSGPAEWLAIPGGLHEIGHSGDGFAFDNEKPRHRVWLEPFEICQSLVTAGDFVMFIEDGGYRRPELWLSDGWTMVETEGWQAPLYWNRTDGGWSRFSLSGRGDISAAEPLLHVSYYEADAFARWAGRRLPTEAEWETAAATGQLHQAADTCWQWTSSAYSPYPGFTPESGAIGEYNGKFMVNQMTLRGGSRATPEGHARVTYRNFFSPASRWAFCGIRLARS
ncbi:MAG: ergothioneine biosynthesis protein EgtB [Novosphingobium sp.]